MRRRLSNPVKFNLRLQEKKVSVKETDDLGNKGSCGKQLVNILLFIELILYLCNNTFSLNVISMQNNLQRLSEQSF